MNASVLRARIQDNPAPLIATGILCALYVVGVIAIGGFGGWSTVQAVLLVATFLGIASAGQTLVVILGGIDLSIPFVIGAANVFVAKLYGDGVDFSVAVLSGLALAAVFGCLNAVIAVKTNVHPLLVTLGSGTALLGLIQWWTGGMPTGGAPDAVKKFVAINSSTGFIPLPPVVFLWLAVVVFMVILTRMTTAGRRLFALGTSPKAAELALVRRLPVWMGAFGLSAVFAAATGILLIGFTGTAFAGVGQKYMFLTIGAVVIGGTLITGGRGGYFGTVLGSLTLTLLTIVLVGFKANDAVQQIIMGLVIIAMVAIYGRDQHVRNRI